MCQHFAKSGFSNDQVNTRFLCLLLHLGFESSNPSPFLVCKVVLLTTMYTRSKSFYCRLLLAQIKLKNKSKEGYWLAEKLDHFCLKIHFIFTHKTGQLEQSFILLLTFGQMSCRERLQSIFKSNFVLKVFGSNNLGLCQQNNIQSNSNTAINLLANGQITAL